VTFSGKLLNVLNVFQQFILCTTVDVRSAVNGPDSSQVLRCEEVPCCRWTWHPCNLSHFLLAWANRSLFFSLWLD